MSRNWATPNPKPISERAVRIQAIRKALFDTPYSVCLERPLLFGWFAAIALVMLASGLAACVIPARRAASVNPVTVLRVG